MVMPQISARKLFAFKSYFKCFFVSLSGYLFQVIDMGTRKQLENGTTAFTNATHLPVLKDSVAVPSGGFVRIRFRATNPSYWIFHCHFEYHASIIFVTLFSTHYKRQYVFLIF